MFRGGTNMGDHERCGCARNTRHAMVLRKPDAVVTVVFSLDRHAARIFKRLADALAFADWRKVENGKGDHPTLLHKFCL